MKRITLFLMAVVFIAGSSVYSQEVTPGAVVVIFKVAPETEDITADQLETFYEKFIPAWNKEAPSIPMHLMKKIEGKRMGEFAEIAVFESLDARNDWFPKPGVSSEKTKKLFENLGEVWDEFRETATGVGHTDYIALPGSGKSIHIKPGNVIMVFECEITLEEGLTPEAFEKFYVEEYGPAYMKAFKGSQFCVLKGDRGERAGKYSELIVFKSMDDFNYWLTSDGMMNEKARKAFSDMGEIQARMEEMYTWSRTNTYVVL